MEKAIAVAMPIAAVEFGGVESFIKQTALFHRADRVRPVYCFLKDGPLVEWMERETQHEVHVLPFTLRLRNPLSVLEASWWIKQVAQASNCQLIHSSMAYAALPGALAASLARLPHIWYQHGPVSGWMDRLAGLLPARAILYNSHYTKQRQNHVMSHLALIQNVTHPHLDHHVHYLGAHLPTLTRSPHPKPRVGMLCRFQRWKGVDLFIRAVRLAHERVGEDAFDAVLWGDPVPGQEDEKHFQEIELLCKAHRIERHPHTDRPEVAISQLDILVNASTIPEPFGLTLVEGMRQGVVPVAPNWGGPKEIIVDQKNGLLFEPKNPADLASKLVELIQNTERRQALSQEAATHSEAKFNAVHSIHQLEDYYAKLVR